MPAAKRGGDGADRISPPGANKINWYPGHMAKTKRALAEQLSRVDLAVELCDARTPRASRNPDLPRLLKGKRRLLVLGKADLADPRETRAWVSYYASLGEDVLAFDSVRGRPKDVIDRAQRACREEVARWAARGARKTVRILVAGIPNVGKSTFVNRLKGEGIAKTGDRPGVTRSQQWVRITPWLELLDTPGLLWPDLSDQDAALRLAWTGTIADRVLDTGMTAIRLLEELMRLIPDATAARFHIRDREARGLSLLHEACRGRGWILPGGIPDEERGAALVLDEFRAGLLGRLTLEPAPARGADTPSGSQAGREAEGLPPKQEGGQTPAGAEKEEEEA